MKPKDVANFSCSFITALLEGSDVLTESVVCSLHDCEDGLTINSGHDQYDWLLKYYSNVDARRAGYSQQN